MARVVVFDSGLGSLSVIKEIQKLSKVEIIYFGDQENFPYGEKSKSELENIIKKSIKKMKDSFAPDLIVVGSNTPTIMLDIEDENIIGVRPPLYEAKKISKTKNIGILGTKSTINSKELSRFIKNSNFNSEIKIHKINGSSLVELVESGKFLTNKSLCKKIIKGILENFIVKENIDVITLSSTHLPFLKSILEKQYPSVTFIDPANSVARKIHQKIKNKQDVHNKLKIFSSGDVKKFQKTLNKLGIKNKVNFLSI
ncbi:MAG: aspartate/glutamate racemase family protein [Nitrosopumilus sp.]|nr:aspartate/glutamate racemase family protein [Nitrosopumilus sp.]MDH3764307.1 aspartate/glutamate racemase family protein [Nitrosopumilus sp.]